MICDIDGCLTPEASRPIDTDALARIRRHNEAAQVIGDRPVVTLCSGRPQPFVEAICRAIGNESLPCIAENGVWLWHPRTNAYEMDPAITPEHLDTVREADRWVRRDLFPRGVSIQPGKSASISLYHPDTALLRGFENGVRERFAREGWGLRVSMTWLYINCDLTHVSKGTGIDRFFAQTGFTRAVAAGIGDTPGDLPIRERTAWFGCPANAHPDIRAIADVTSGLPEARGVIELLDSLRSDQSAST